MATILFFSSSFSMTPHMTSPAISARQRAGSLGRACRGGSAVTWLTLVCVVLLVALVYVTGQHRHWRPGEASGPFGEGRKLVTQGRFQEALADFDRAIELEPTYPGAFHKRGLVQEKLGRHAEAVQDFDRAIELNPEYGAAYFSRASLHTKLSNEDAALADMQMVTHLGNRNLETYMGDNNVWHTQQMRVEDAMETELNR